MEVLHEIKPNRKIAIVSIGYGDGIPRSLSNVGKIFFKCGKNWSEANIIGRVSMDNIICDVTNIKKIKSGDWGYLIFDEYTVDDIARDAGTISYEVFSRVGKNPRFDRKFTTKWFFIKKTCEFFSEMSFVFWIRVLHSTKLF